MTTGASLTPLVLRRLALVLVGTLLVSGAVAPVATSSLPCRAATMAAAAASAAPVRDLPVSRGVDLELRVLNLRVEFPWLKSLPVTPGHRIVISWMATPARE